MVLITLMKQYLFTVASSMSYFHQSWKGKLLCCASLQNYPDKEEFEVEGQDHKMPFALHLGDESTITIQYICEQHKKYLLFQTGGRTQRETVWQDASKMCPLYAVPHVAAKKAAQLHSSPWFPIVDMLQRNALILNGSSVCRCYRRGCNVGNSL